MGLFDDMLKDSETLFRDSVALDYDFIPKLVPYRESQQQFIASCIKPLFQKQNGKNLFIYGPPGIGKTVATKHLLRELEEETDEIIPLYINCWQHNTTYKVLVEVCNLLGYKFVQNKKTSQLAKIVSDILNKKTAVLVIDEVDKLEDIDFLYSFLEGIYRKTIVMITNFKSWLFNLDPRIKSRLVPELLEFQPYNLQETRGILKQRLKYAFVPDCWNEKAFDLVVAKTVDLADIRSGLHLMKEAGHLAEEQASQKIKEDHVKEVIKKFDQFTVKKSNLLQDVEKSILQLVRDNPQQRIGDLFKIYQQSDNQITYKTFQRKIKKLEQNKFITCKKVISKEGNTSIISPANKKITDF